MDRQRLHRRRGRAISRHLAALAILSALLFAAASPPAHANNGLQFIGAGVKGAGRGGAETAVGDSALSVARNPALLLSLPGRRIDASLVWFQERTRTRDDFGDELNTVSVPIPFPSVGFALDPARTAEGEPSDDGLRFGFGLYTPAALVFAPTGSVAFRASPRLALGFSLNVLMTYLQFDSEGGSIGGSGGSSDFVPRGDVDIFYQPDGSPVIPPQPFDAGTGQQVTWAEVWEAVGGGVNAPPPGATERPPQPQVLIEVRGAFGVGLAGQFGALWTPREDVALGLGVRTPGIIFRPRGRGRLDFDKAIETLQQDPAVALLLGGLIDTYVPERGRNGFASDYDVETDRLIVPPEVSVGLAWWPTDRWMIAADLRWIGWDMALDTIRLRATGGKNADINEIAGGSTVEYDLKLLWRDQFVAAIGTSVGVTDWLAVRAGYNYGNNPVPQRTLSASSLVVEHHLTVGATAYLGHWDLDLAYVWGLPKELQIDSDRVRFRTELHVLHFGVGYRW